MGFLAFVVVYILGGVTFLPLLAFSSAVYLYRTLPIVQHSELIEPADEAAGVVTTKDEKTLNKLKKDFKESDAPAGYFAVTREWTPGGINGKPPERITPVGSASIKGDESSQSMYQTVVRSIFDRKSAGGKGDGNGAPKKKRALNVFYVVLRHGHLMLYDDSDQQEVRHVISLSHHNVSIYGGGEEIPEGELYIRRNAICLSRKDGESHQNATLTKPFFLFSENCSEKEDFYFALLKHQEQTLDDPSSSSVPAPLKFDQAHLILLVQQLHSSEEQYQTRWVNALLGRLFLALYKTPDIENFFKKKITKKIARVKKPAFLSDISIQKVDVGDGVPYITNPKLRDLNVNGECIIEAHVSYGGNFRLEIFTAARIDLGARFKTREVDLMLSAVLKKLEGKILIRIKPPPSNRIWIAFESTPKMDLDIEPIISSRSITYRPILQLIENRVREVVEETLVLPHWDDLPFTDTINQAYRGGVWQEPAAPVPSVSEPALVVTELDKTSASDDSAAVSTGDHKSLSMPDLPSLSPDSKKYASSAVNALEGSGSESSGLTHRVHRKPKSMRTSSFNQLTAPQPVVSTDAVNVTAVRSESTNTEKDRGGARSAMKTTMDRTRSVSMSGSPRCSPFGSPPSIVPTPSTSSVSISEEQEKPDEFFPALEEPMESARSTPRHSRSQSLSTALSAPPLPSSPPNAYGGQPRNFTKSSSSIGNRASSTLSAALNQQNTVATATGNKPAINNAINNATAAVKKWYKGRTEGNNSSHVNGPSSPNTIDSFLRNGTHYNSSSSNIQPAPSVHLHHISPLPPPDIPPPPAKRTAPIAVPKRKPLPPPLLPARNKQHAGGVVDDVMVVAAPLADPDEDSSEPGTPPDEFMVSLDGNTIQHHNQGNGLVGLGMMLRSDRPSSTRRGSNSNSNSNSGSGSASGSSWDLKQRARGASTGGSGSGMGIGNISLKNKNKATAGTGMGGEDEPWDAAEEAELKGKAGW